jgi:hypothetical protein
MWSVTPMAAPARRRSTGFGAVLAARPTNARRGRPSSCSAASSTRFAPPPQGSEPVLEPCRPGGAFTVGRRQPSARRRRSTAIPAPSRHAAGKTNS